MSSQEEITSEYHAGYKSPSLRPGMSRLELFIRIPSGIFLHKPRLMPMTSGHKTNCKFQDAFGSSRNALHPLGGHRMRSTSVDKLESKVRYYAQRFPATFTRATGPILWDAEGKAYIDFFVGSGALNYGHNPPGAKKALQKYILDDGIVHSLDFSTTARREFVQAFDDIILQPRGYRYRIMFTGPTGADAVEAALKLARKITKRPNIVAFTNAFHGVSLGALAATGAARQRGAAGLPLSHVHRFPFDGYFGGAFDTIEFASRMLDDKSSGFDPPAAFLVETVQAEGGVITASLDWLQRLAELAKKHSSLLIVDDIQAGCGRTGTFFSFEPARLNPDIICLSKSLSGNGLPLSSLLIRPDLDIWQPGEHSGTFRGNNYAFVTGRAVLDYWRSAEFEQELSKNIDHFDRGLLGAINQFSSKKFSLRGRGMLRGIVCQSGALAARVAKAAFVSGLVVETCGSTGEVIKLLPPINIKIDVLNAGIERLTTAMRSAVKTGAAS